MRQVARMNRRLFSQGGVTIFALMGAGMTASAQSASPAQVKIKRFKYEPEVLHIKVGASVTWTNMDAAPHTATDSDGNWETATLKRKQSDTITFNTPGTYEYFCAHHPNMKAKVIVEN